MDGPLYLFNKYKNLITTCHFSKKEGTLDNGMKPFLWKYSDELNQTLNPTFDLNPKKGYVRRSASENKCSS